MGAHITEKYLKPRVCVIAPLYHPSLGGIGRQAKLLSERLAGKGVDIFVIARRMKGMPPAVFDPDVHVCRAWSIKPFVHTFERITIRNILISLTFSMSCAMRLFLKRKDYDIVHFHGASLPLFINIFLLKMMGKKVIAKVAAAGVGTEAGSLKGRYYFIDALIIRLLKKVDMFIATSSEIEEGLKNDGFSNIKRITNFIDIDMFCPASPDKKLQLKESFGYSGKLLLTFSGRFIQRKGIDCLLRAWKEVADQVPEASLELLGDGPLLPEMKIMTQNLRVGNSVIFRGHVDKITQFLHMTDIFILPSLQEGMPNALLEAMACGLPSIASRIGGVVDVITDGKSGILFEPGDAAGLASAMLTLIKDAGLRQRLGEEARKNMVERFSIDSIAAEYIKLYGKLAEA